MLKQYVRKSGKRVIKKRVRATDGSNRMVTLKTPIGGHKVGVLVAQLNAAGEIVIGHSKWHQKADAYNAALAEEVAEERMRLEKSTTPALSLYKPYHRFLKRAQRYFKTEQLSAATRVAVETLEHDMIRHRKDMAELAVDIKMERRRAAKNALAEA